MKIIWTPLSIQRIQEIADYIAIDNISAANDWIDSIFKKVDLLKSSPELGRIVPEIMKKEIRELIHGNYGIIYSRSSKQLAILTIRHFKQILPEKEI
jgi:toxin ParE1/3/4